MLLLIVLSIAIIDIGIGHWKRLERFRVIPTVRISLAVASPFIIHHYLDSVLQYKQASYNYGYELVWIYQKFYFYLAASLISILVVVLLLVTILVIRMKKDGIEGAKGIRTVCRICMVLSLVMSLGYGLITINKVIDLAAYILILAICQNGYFFIPTLIKQIIKDRPSHC